MKPLDVVTLNIAALTGEPGVPDGRHDCCPYSDCGLGRKFSRGESTMHTSINKIFAATIMLALLIGISVSSADAQSRYRYRDRGLSTGEKVAAIGGGAAAGALLGGLLGGKKGAVIGGVLGAGGGTGFVLLKDRDNDRYGRYYSYRDSRYFNDYNRDWRDRNWRDRDRDDRYRWEHNRFRR